MRRMLVGGTVTLLAMIAAPASMAGGMASFEFEEDYVLVGESVTGRATFSTDVRGTGRIENGPWHAYLLPSGTWIEPPRIPEGAIHLGPIAIEGGSDRGAVASITFTVPEVTTGGYFIGMCNVPCAESFVGDLGGGWLTIARTEEGASLLRKLDKTDRQLNRVRYRLARRIKDVEGPLEQLEGRVDGVQSSIELRLDRLEERLRASLAPDQDRGGIPWGVALLAAGVLAVAALVGRSRRPPRPRPVLEEPPVVEWELPEEVSART